MTDLFQTPDQTAIEPQIDPNKNYLEELVGPGKKFADAEALAKGKWYADEMIKIKNQREDELRDDYIKVSNELKQKATFEDLVKQLASNKEPPVKEEIQPSFDPSKFRELVSEEVQRTRTAEKQQENTRLVMNKLKEQFGTNYQNILKQKTEDLGLSEDFVRDLAKNHPEVLFKTLSMDQAPSQNNSFQAPPRSQQRSDSFSPTGAKKRTWAYYQELKKADPKLYFDRKTAVQMAQDAVELGEEFRDGDYYRKGLHEI